jgi:hypothetical protein
MHVKMVVLDYKDGAPFSVQSGSSGQRKTRRYSFSLRSTGTTAMALFWNKVVNGPTSLCFSRSQGSLSLVPTKAAKSRSQSC